MASNISPGGQVYDRTTGTWVGENQGSIGDGINRSASGNGSRVWHDANGVVGVQFATPAHAALAVAKEPLPVPVPVRQVAAPAVQTAPSGGGAGPGSPAVTTGGPAGAGVGPGAGGAVTWEPAPSVGGVPGSLVEQVGLPPLEQKANPNVTQLMVGGDWWHANPWFSDAEEYATRYGEGEIAETAFFLTNVVADFAYNSYRFGNAYAVPFVNSSAFALNDWVNGIPARVNGPLPVQEPVDWGH